jgi:VWFA-related protein
MEVSAMGLSSLYSSGRISFGSFSVGLLSVGLLSAAATLVTAQTPIPPAAPGSSQPLAGHPANESSSPAANGSMQLSVVVTDKGGKNVPGLGVGDFQLLDNNRPMRITSFRAFGGSAPPAQTPAKVIIVFDTVNMPFDSVSYTREQVSEFLRQNGGHLAAPVTLAFLNNTDLQVVSDATTDGNALAKKLDESTSNLRTLNRSAGSWGAVERFEFSLKMLGTLVQKIMEDPGRKLVIWAGPGWPLLDNPNVTFSAQGQKAFFNSIVGYNTMLREGQIELSSVSQGMPNGATYLYESYLKGVKKATQAQPTDLALKVLATQSGGRVIPPSNDLAAAVTAVVQDAGTYYEITFDPPPPDGPNEYHDLKIKVNQPGLSAHTNTGYYGKPEAVSAP